MRVGAGRLNGKRRVRGVCETYYLDGGQVRSCRGRAKLNVGSFPALQLTIGWLLIIDAWQEAGWWRLLLKAEHTDDGPGRGQKGLRVEEMIRRRDYWNTSKADFLLTVVCRASPEAFCVIRSWQRNEVCVDETCSDGLIGPVDGQQQMTGWVCSCK